MSETKKKAGRDKTYPQLWADLLEKHDGDAEVTLKEYRRIGALAKEQGLGHDCELDDVRQPDPSTEPKRRGRPPKAVTQARQAAAAAAAAAAGEDDEEEGGSCMLAKGRRGSGRLQAVLAAAAAHTSDDDEEPPRSAGKAKPKRKPGRPPSAAGIKKARSSLGGMTDDKEQLYQQLLKAKEGEVEANKRRADDLMKLALAFAQGKGKLPAQSGDGKDTVEDGGSKQQQKQLEELQQQLKQQQRELAAREAALKAKEKEAAKEAEKAAKQELKRKGDKPDKAAAAAADEGAAKSTPDKKAAAAASSDRTGTPPPAAAGMPAPSPSKSMRSTQKA